MKLKREPKYYRNLLKTVLVGTNACLIILDVEIRRYVYFANAEHIFGIKDDDIMAEISQFDDMSAEEYSKAVSRYFTHPDDWKARGDAFTKAINGEISSYEARMKSSATEFKWCKVKLYPYIVDGEVKEVIGLCYDIEELKRANKRIEKIEGTDEFTGGYNKVRFFSKVRDALKTYKDGQHSFIMLDLDDFKYINDTYGHSVGDLVLLGLSRKLKNLALKNGGYFGRFGGDEFVIFVPNYANMEALKRGLDRITKLEIEDISLTASIGVSLCPDDAKTAEELFLMADAAVYHSKDTGKGKYTFYSETAFDIKKRIAHKEETE